MLRIGFVIDPLDSLNHDKDSSLLLMAKATELHGFAYAVDYRDMWLEKNQFYCKAHKLRVEINSNVLIEDEGVETLTAQDFEMIVLRKDPPFDQSYLYLTYLLDFANQHCRVINNPSSVRDANEKLFAMQFPNCIPETIVTNTRDAIFEFAKAHEEIILKPLNGMGGDGVFRSNINDSNLENIIHDLTADHIYPIMAQEFIPAITDGDKRVLIVNSEVIPFVLARIPAAGDFRGNLAQGARGVVQPISDVEMQLAKAVSPTLVEKGLSLVGLDVIGDKITEINVTSPTGLRQIERESGIDIAGMLIY